MAAGFTGWHAPGSRDPQQGAHRSAQTRDDDFHTVAPDGCAGLLQWWFITPVRREEHNAANSMPYEAVDEVVDDHLQRLGPQRQRPREREMVLGTPDPYRRGAQGVEALGEEGSQAIGEDSVSVERQV
jgi:hypothetical protein